jgi:hypothetical protein
MTTANPDTDAILAEPTKITLSSGREVVIQRIKTVQMIRLLRVLTKGVGDAIMDLDFQSDDAEALGKNIGMLALLSIPEAEGETIDFISSLVEPADLIRNPKTKADKEQNQEILTEFFYEMQNPELDDLITIMEIVVKNEAPTALALGKRVAALLQTQKKSVTAKSGSRKKA